MTNYKQGDIVLLEFIFSERVGAKKRPALILSSDIYHQSRQEIIVAAITSNIKRNLVGDSMISDWKKAGLPKPSIVTGIIQTFKHNLIERQLGSLSDQDYKTVQQNLKKALAF
ncbi:MAG: mRNA interferase MazF [Candidatus Omnitrophota bacterium]|jgi:mRNA interferase MazF